MLSFEHYGIFVAGLMSEKSTGIHRSRYENEDDINTPTLYYSWEYLEGWCILNTLMLQYINIKMVEKGETRGLSYLPSHEIRLQIRVLPVSSKQKIGHFLFNTATAWHSLTVEHNTLYRTWQHSFKGNYLVLRVCNR